MKCITTLALSVLAVCSTSYSLAEETAPSSTSWVSLFDGKTLEYWDIRTSPANAGSNFISVDTETIWAYAPLDNRPKGHVWLVSKKEYSDFVFKMKFQTVEGGSGNSGIQIRSRLDEKGIMQGPQVDLHPKGPWRTGMLYDMTSGVKRFLAPDHQVKDLKPSMAAEGFVYYNSSDSPSWNEIEISAVNNHITCVLNGIVVMELLDTKNILNDETHQKQNVGTTGIIAIQIHGGDISDLRIKDVFIKDMTVKTKP